MSLTILEGDCREVLKTLPADSVQCCVTSPPYFGLRDYKVSGQIGLEPTPSEYVDQLVAVFRALWPVLRDDGTLWLNLGDSFNSSGRKDHGDRTRVGQKQQTNLGSDCAARRTDPLLKPKDMFGIPWRVAFALQEDGWYLRSDIIWDKPSCMPESVTDRPTRSHEYIFLLTKNQHYYYDAAAIREQPSPALLKQIAEGYNGHATKDFLGNGVQDASQTKGRIIDGYREKLAKVRGHERPHEGFNGKWDQMTKAEQMACGSNKRSVWRVASAGFAGSHYATFPPDLIKPCILAGSRVGDTVLDPFGGSGTTGQVALELGRSATLIELNPEYVNIIRDRTNVTPGMI